MKYSNETLLKRIEAGERLKYIFFWGHRPALDGSINKSCFSQWYESPFEQDGITYPTAEHWMMAEKARLFKDTEILEEIIQARTAAEAKKLGRKVRNFDNAIWNENREEIVIKGNYLKFSQDEKLQDFLLKTGDRILVEASPYDRIWGIGLKADDTRAQYPEKWQGLNLLGYALMEARDQLKTFQ